MLRIKGLAKVLWIEKNKMRIEKNLWKRNKIFIVGLKTGFIISDFCMVFARIMDGGSEGKSWLKKA